MEESKKKIVRLAKRLDKIILIIMILFAAVIAVSLAGIVVILINEGSFENIYNILDRFDLVTKLGFDDDITISLKVETIIMLVMLIMNFIIYIVFLRIIKKLFKNISEDNTPFTKENARIFKKAAWVSLILALISNIIIAIVIFSALMLFSALFEYGAYLQSKADETNRIQEEMIVSFAEITENKSSQTGNHVKRVSEYSRIIAEQLGLSNEEVERIRLASTMHDIGKLLIPAEILEKPAKLTDEEFAIIKKHSGYGGELLENVEGDIMQLARKIALDHHERPDGHGYPDGKIKDDISVEGRIVAVADVYDALTSRRSYKEAWEEDRAYSEIVSGSGTQFDPGVVAAFERVYDQVLAVRKKYVD